MATLIDERPEDTDEEGTTAEEAKAEAITEEPQPLEAIPEPQEPEPSVEELPEKYRGKTVAEVAKMHQEAEKLAGRHGARAGELESVVNKFLEAKFEEPTVQPEEEIDIFTDPDKYVESKIASHPAVKRAEAAEAEMRRATAKASLELKHPDMDKIVEDPAFGEWIKASNVRTRMFQQAHQQFDAEQADELFSLWKDRQGAVTRTAEYEEKERKQKVKKASTGSSRSSNNPSTKPQFRKVDVIKLMKEDPDRYMAMEPEIRQAYAEGRVK